MAGHSHATNIKYRKGRQDQARGQLFLKLRKKITNLLREEGQITKKVLNLARENGFPHEKVQQIWNQIQAEEAKSPSIFFYQAAFDILIYYENRGEKEQNASSLARLAKKENWKQLPLSVLYNHFRPFFSLKLELSVENYNPEDYLLTYFPLIILEKIEKINYWNKIIELISFEQKSMETIKSLIQKEKLSLQIIAEKKSWEPLFPRLLTTEKEKNYYKEIKKNLGYDIQKIVTNVDLE
jgi:hypothetical protein